MDGDDVEASAAAPAPAAPGNRNDAPGSTLRRVLAIVPRVKVRLHGASMWPLILPDVDAVLLRCQVDELRVGDVAVYVRDARVVAHVVRTLGATGPRPSALGRIGLEDAITNGILLGRIDGMVFRRRHLQRTPRSVARTVAHGVGLLMRLRSLVRRSAHAT